MPPPDADKRTFSLCLLFHMTSSNRFILSDIILCMKIWESEEAPLALTIKEVEHLALLARLNLSTEEKAIYAEQLSSILDFIETLNKLPTDGVEPLIQVLPLFNVMRDDVACPSLSKDEVMANASLQEDGQFKVPRLV